MSGVIDAKTPGQALAITLRMGADKLGWVEDRMSEARRLLAHAAGVERSRLQLLEIEDFDDARISRYMDAVYQRNSGVPMSHILGFRGFWKHGFRVTPDVLRPKCLSSLRWSSRSSASWILAPVPAAS